MDHKLLAYDRTSQLDPIVRLEKGRRWIKLGQVGYRTRLSRLWRHQSCRVQSQCATWIVPTPASWPVFTSSSIVVNVPMRGSIAMSVPQEESFDIGAGQASIGVLGGRGSCLSTRAPPNIWSRFEFSSPLSLDTHTRSNSTIVFPFITAPPTTCRLYSSSILFRRLLSSARPQQPCSSLGGLSPNSDLH